MAIGIERSVQGEVDSPLKSPSFEETACRLLALPPAARDAVDRIAQRLVALNEYNMEQAHFVATDIVRWRFFKTSQEKEITP